METEPGDWPPLPRRRHRSPRGLAAARDRAAEAWPSSRSSRTCRGRPICQGIGITIPEYGLLLSITSTKATPSGDARGRWQLASPDAGAAESSGSTRCVIAGRSPGPTSRATRPSHAPRCRAFLASCRTPGSSPRPTAGPPRRARGAPPRCCDRPLGRRSGRRRHRQAALRVTVADLGHQVLAERVDDIQPGAAAEDMDRRGPRGGAPRRGRRGAPDGRRRDGDPRPDRPGVGRARPSTILPGWVGVHAREAMSERTGPLEVLVDNDANLGVLSEWTWGAARDCAKRRLPQGRHGIGAGLILEGRLFHGAGGRRARSATRSSTLGPRSAAAAIAAASRCSSARPR